MTWRNYQVGLSGEGWGWEGSYSAWKGPHRLVMLNSPESTYPCMRGMMSHVSICVLLHEVIVALTFTVRVILVHGKMRHGEVRTISVRHWEQRGAGPYTQKWQESP